MNHEEWIEQVKVIEWLKQCTDLPYMAITNERKCSPQQARRLEQAGRISGVVDLLLPRGSSLGVCLWIEMKSKLGRLSAAQIKFMKDRRLEGACAEVAYSADEAILYIKHFYGLE